MTYYIKNADLNLCIATRETFASAVKVRNRIKEQHPEMRVVIRGQPYDTDEEKAPHCA